MQHLNFGYVESLTIQSAEPVLSPKPIIVRERKFASEPEGHQDSEDYLLKAQIVELFLLFDEIRNGTIRKLEVKHGIPFRAMYEPVS